MWGNQEAGLVESAATDITFSRLSIDPTNGHFGGQILPSRVELLARQEKLLMCTVAPPRILE
jgi:hypothetical protein